MSMPDVNPSPQATARKHVFISYARANKTLVNRLIADLQAAGVAVWIDNSGLEPGTPNWEEALRSAIRDSYVLLYLGARASRSSNYVLAEIDIASMYDLPILPIWIEGKDGHWADAAPFKQIKAQYIDLREDFYDANLPVVVSQLLELQGTPVAPPKTTFLRINPYKGLRAFTQDDTQYFFGRQAETKTLVTLLDERRFVSILGASGSGKSSLVMAGVLPKLEPRVWTTIRLVPGNRPILALANLLGNAVSMSATEVEKDLNRPDGLGLHLFASRLTERAKTTRLLLFVDQFEEVFTHVTNDEDRRVFFDLLTKATAEPLGVVTVILTMRADFYDRPMAYPALFEQMIAHFPLPPMSNDNLHDAIVRPADAVGLCFEDGLVGDLLFEVREEAGALPLLQFTLDLLYRACVEAQGGVMLTVAAYQRLNGVRGALATYAEAEYLKLNATQARLARALFLRLIEPGATQADTTRRRTLQKDFDLFDADDSAQLQIVMRAFVDARLLTTDSIGEGEKVEETVEVAHEALITVWERLGTWISDSRTEVLLGKKINIDAAAWVAWLKAQHPTPAQYGAFYRGTVLVDAESWAQRATPSREEMAFIQAGRADEDRLKADDEARKNALTQAGDHAQTQSRRARVAIRIALVLTLIAIIASVIAVVQGNNARQEQAALAAQAQLSGTRAAEALAARSTADTQLQVATGTLGQVQNQATQVAAQATNFGIEQAHISTLSAGGVIIPLGTLTPAALVPTLTGIAQLIAWQPRIIAEEINGVRIEMVEVPPGCFMMGSIAAGNEQPIHEQCFDAPFYIDRYEVSQTQFSALAGVKEMPMVYEGDYRPVDNTSWFEARDYCQNQRNARLPTEREWEYAARGPNSLTYPWGNQFVADYVASGRSAAQGTPDMIDAAGAPLRPNGASWVGALDMSGSIFEWTSTRFDDLDFSERTNNLLGLFPYPYQADDREADETFEAFTQRQPLITQRTIRGGSWSTTSSSLRAAARVRENAHSTFYSVGLRCAR